MKQLEAVNKFPFILGAYEQVEQMLNEKPSTIKTVCTRGENTAAHIACDQGDLKMCLLLDKFDCDWEALDRDDMTPIFYAVRCDKIEIL